MDQEFEDRIKTGLWGLVYTIIGAGVSSFLVFVVF